MLTVASQPLLSSLISFLTSPTSPTSQPHGSSSTNQWVPSVNALVTLIELSALLGLEEVCESCVQALATASGLPPLLPPSPSPYLSHEEGRQLEALRALLGLAESPVACLLGSGWAVLLRVSLND